MLAACLGLVACGSNKESPAEAKQNLCTSAQAFSASVASLATVGLSSSEDQLKSAVTNVQDAWNKMIADAKDVKTANTDNVKQAYGDLKQAVQNRPTDKPVSEVLAGMTSQLTAFADAWRQFANSLDCKTS